MSLFTHIAPKFNKGRILKTAMLENLRDFPRDFTDVYYQDYTDGIVTGATISVGSDSLTVAPGIVKHQGRIYIMKQPAVLSYIATGRESVVKIRFQEGREDSDWHDFRSEIVLDQHLEMRGSELELCRFKLKDGARLRQDYQNFQDMATEYNTVNVLHVRIASFGKSTLTPVIMRQFAEEMLGKGSADSQDMMFAMMCLNEGTVSRDVILHYIARRLGITYKDYSNVEIHKYLARIHEQARGSSRMGMGLGASQRMIVD
jgi:hypothetical protein